MVVFNLGYTAPINRPDQYPVLTASQVWAGLQLKVRDAALFVPIIQDCKVVSDNAKSDESGDMTTVVRYITFRPGSGDGGPDGEAVKEICNEFAPCRVDFCRDDGTKISNCITQGASGEPEDLMLTYIFERKHPSVRAGSEEAKALEVIAKDVSDCSLLMNIDMEMR